MVAGGWGPGEVEFAQEDKQLAAVGTGLVILPAVKIKLALDDDARALAKILGDGGGALAPGGDIDEGGFFFCSPSLPW